MKKRIHRSICLLALSLVVLTGVLLVLLTYSSFERNLQTQLQNEAQLLAFGLNGAQDPLQALQDASALGQGLRISYIDASGDVLFDNQAEAGSMENHLQREEVQEALKLGQGRDSRLSATLGQQTYYQAVRLQNGNVLRLSQTVSSVYAQLFSLVQLLLPISIAVLLFSYWLSGRMTTAILRPLNELSLDNADSAAPVYDELAPLLGRISLQKRQIDLQQERLRQKQQEFETISENMAEGLVLLDGRGYVLAINQSALKRLRMDGKKALGRHALYLSREPAFRDAVNRALEGSHAELILDEPRCQLLADPVFEGEQVRGAALLLIALTDAQEAERLRREFTANVSHELKTPLTSISGYAELIENHLAQEKDIPLFAARIRQESGRLLALVQDILRLSQLDEGYTGQNRQRVYLLPLIQAQAARLEQALRDKGLHFCLEGTDEGVDGYPSLLEELFYNLLDNAIRYNHEGGEVRVTLSKADGCVSAAVSDTGIGIAEEHQARVFERFYRVDKSHSKKTGGTGLGLAIVKHIAGLHGAQIQLDSTPGVGTTVRLLFPKA